MRSRLETLRESSNKKNIDLCKYLGVSEAVYSRWEHNKRIISLTRIVQISNYYKVNLDYTLGISNNKKYILNESKIDKTEIGARLKAIRNEIGLTQSKLSKFIGVARSTLSECESGRRVISVNSLVKLCKKYNYSADWIIGRSEDKFLK